MRAALAIAAGLLAAVVAANASAQRLNDEIAAGGAVVLEELEAWDAAKARQAVEELAARHPDAPAVQGLLARVRFEEGDHAAAVALLDKAGDTVDRRTVALIRGTAETMRGTETQESAHFTIRAKPGKDMVLALYALDALERQYAALANDLGFAPRSRIPIDVVEDVKGLSKLTGLPVEALKTSGTIAVCKYSRIILTSPKALVRGYDWLDTLSHEYTHLVISQMSRNKVPIWVHEGLAKFLESRWRGAAGTALPPAEAGLLASELKADKLIPFDRMHPSMALLPSQTDVALAYAEVFTAIEYLHKKHGMRGLIAVIEGLRDGATYQVAVSRVAGVPSFDRFEAAWRGWLHTREFPKEALPLDASKRKFTEDEAAPKKGTSDAEREQIRFGDFLEIKDVEGRKLAHLGELLRIRNRHKAAAEEFSKAYARVGNRSSALANRYAQTLIKLGDLQQAERLLTASLVPFPGHPRTHQNLADVMIASGRGEQAETHLLEVVGIDPFDPKPHQELLKIYTTRKDEPRAKRERTALNVLAGGKAPPANQGTIVVKSRPYAKVLLNGVDTGRSTPTTLSVAPGSHALRLVNPERGISKDAMVEVGAGDEKTVDVSLE